MNEAVHGFFLGLSLIVAIGAQNAFVLRQGLRRSHVFTVCLICALSDAVLISVGVAGIGEIIQFAPMTLVLLRIGGVVFLTVYGAMAARKAWRGGEGLTAAPGRAGSLAVAAGTALAFTWLNPHVWLDTVVLVGTVAASTRDPWVFGAGAMLASFVFFFSLGYGARLLEPFFARPVAWRILDGLIAVVMWMIAAGLALG